MMQSIPLGVSSLSSSRLAYGCWRVAGTWNPAEVTPESRAAGAVPSSPPTKPVTRSSITRISTASASGAHPRCRAEEIPEMRGKVLIMTKGGIRPGGDPQPGAPARYDFSAEYLVRACEQSLRRLGIETIDVYLLHRPDYLADPEEIARAFSQLERCGQGPLFRREQLPPDAGHGVAGGLPDAAGRAPGGNQPGAAGRLHGRHARPVPGRADHSHGLESPGGGA